ncbi:MAG: type II toxin-antitoxin system VapB family antitoxin [Luteolibacter sp.]
MKTTIDIPDQVLADAMRFTGAKTKREAVVKAIEEFNRRNKVDQVIGMFGTWTDFPTNDELEAADVADMERKIKEWNANDEEPHTDR